MKKRMIYCTFFLLSVIVLLMACQATPEKPPVVNKGNGALESAVRRTAEAGDNTIKEDWWKDSFSEKGMNITVNAEIKKPMTNNLPVYKICSRSFTKEELEKFVNVFFGDNDIYEYDDYTQADMEETLVEAKIILEKLKQGDKDIIEPGISIEEQIQYQEEQIRELEKKISIAPENNVGKKAIIDYTQGNYGESVFEVCTITNDIRSVLSVSKDVDGMKDRSGMSYYRDIDETVSMDAVKGEPSIGLEDAIKIAEETLERMEVGDITFAYSDVVAGEGKDHYLHRMTFARAYDGIPMSLIEPVTEYMDENNDGSGEEYSRLFNTEEIVVTVDEEGISQLEWKYPCQVVELVNENAKLKPFDEIKESFQNYVFVKQIAAEGDEIDIKIEEARLSYALLRIKDGEEGEFYTAPMWDFIGSCTKHYNDMDDSVEEDVSIVSINALDGSNYDRILKY